MVVCEKHLATFQQLSDAEVVSQRGGMAIWCATQVLVGQHTFGLTADLPPVTMVNIGRLPPLPQHPAV